MKNLNKFSKTIGQLLLVILISFFSGLLGSLAVLHFNQKQGSGEQNSAAVTQTASKNENSNPKLTDLGRRKRSNRSSNRVDEENSSTPDK